MRSGQLSIHFLHLLVFCPLETFLQLMCDCLKDVESRLDLRHLAVCSIDPPGCTDIDDALHWRLLENGNYEVMTEKTKELSLLF